MTGTSVEPFRGRISVNEQYVTLSAVTGSDEGSYTIRDNVGDIKKKVCLDVKGESTNTDIFFPMLDSFKGRGLSLWILLLLLFVLPYSVTILSFVVMAFNGSSRLMHFMSHGASVFIQCPSFSSVSQGTKAFWVCLMVKDWRSTWYSTALWSNCTTLLKMTTQPICCWTREKLQM